MRTSICSRADIRSEPSSQKLATSFPARRYRSPSPSGNERRRCGPPFARAPGSTTQLDWKASSRFISLFQAGTLLSVPSAEHHVRTRRLFLKRDEGVRYLEGGRRTQPLGGALRVVHVLLPGFKRAQYDRALQAAGAENPSMKPAGFASTDVTARSAMMMVNRFIS